MPPKIFKTCQQQINILRSRGMSINKTGQGSRVMRILEKENYYSVVNGYKDPFIASTAPETYISNTEFEELYALFTFDRNIRLIYLKYILKAEHHLKTVIAHEFSRKYGHDNYLKISNFDVSSPKKLSSVTKLMGKIQSEIANNMNKNKEVTHYMSSYGYVPLWVLMNILTIGEISYFYAALKQTDMNAVAKEFNVPPFELAKYIRNLTLARNLCAHDERFYDFHYREALAPSTINNFQVLNIPVSNGNCLYGVQDAYAMAVILTLLLSKADVKEFIASMDKEFKKLKNGLSSITITQIQNVMGYGADWKNLSKLK